MGLVRVFFKGLSNTFISCHQVFFLVKDIPKAFFTQVAMVLEIVNFFFFLKLQLGTTLVSNDKTLKL